MTYQDETLLPPLPETAPLRPGQQHQGWAALLRQQRLQASPWQGFAAAVARRYGRPVAQGRTGEGVSQETTAQATGPAAEAPEVAGDLAALEQTSPQSLDRRSREILAAILPFPLPAVQIYANSLADTIARQYQADALTFRNRILFRNQAYAPHRREGLALLGHELTHVRQGPLPGSGDETQALANEQKIYAALEPVGALTSPSHLPGAPPPGRPWQPARGSFFTPQTPASLQAPPGRLTETGTGGTVRAARSDRPLGTSSSGAPQEAALPEISESQLGLIKEEVYRDIMQRIRTEFERGG